MSSWNRTGGKHPLFFIRGARFNDNWPEPVLGPVNVINPKYPLPGRVGIVHHDFIPSKGGKQTANSLDWLPPHSTITHQTTAWEVMVGLSLNEKDEMKKMKQAGQLECGVHDFTGKLSSEFKDLFTDLDLEKKDNVTVLSLCHKTNSDMSGFSKETAEERTKLADEFISAAFSIVESLRRCGYWADFIDPYSGTPHLGSHTNAAPLFETDHRMTHFGYCIEDLGCCKVLSHGQWGHNIFVGVIFTDAPLNHPLVQTVKE